MKHTGGCHCGNVRFEVDGLDLGKVISCNCSICSKKGTWLAFAPDSNFKLLKGENSLKNYQFNKKVIDHLFCTNCGVQSFGKGTSPDGVRMAAINVRCLDGVDLEKITPHPFNGKAI